MVRMRNVENMIVSKEVLDKIRTEEKKHPYREFGGFLIVKNNGYIKDIIFDMSNQSAGSVNLGTKEILKLSPKQRKMVKGWFHRHPINGLSYTDINTTTKLTKLWNVCYTMVLQSNGKILLLKTIKAKEFGNKPFNLNYGYDDFATVIWPEFKFSWPNLKFWKKAPVLEKPEKEAEPEPEPATESKTDTKPQEEATTETKQSLLQLKPIDKELVVEVFRKEIPFGKFKYPEVTATYTKKFKVYDNVSKTMSKPFTFELLLKENTITFPDFFLAHDDIINRLFRNSLTFLQSTNFTDINKTEIYENDKVTFITTFHIKKTGTITFHIGAWKIKVNENNNTNYYDLYKETRTLSFVSNQENVCKQCQKELN